LSDTFLSNQNRSLGMTVIGQTGFGKSIFLQNLILDDIREGRSAIVFDPHGDLTTDILESVPKHLAGNVSVLQVNETMPFGLNIYECDNPDSSLAVSRTVDNAMLVFKRMIQAEKESHPHIEHLLRNLGHTILANPEYTLADVGLMFEQTDEGKLFRSHLLQKIDNRNIRAFWQGYEERSKNLAYTYIEPLLNKVSPFITSDAMRLIVAQNKTTIPFSDFLDHPGKTLIISLPIGELGEEMTQALGMMLLSMLSEHIYERVRQRQERRIPLHLYIDELGRFMTSGTAIAKLLKEGRKFNVGTTLAFQTFSDLPDREAQSAVLQTGTLVFFQVIGGTDAEILTRQLKVENPSTELIPKMRMEPNYKEWDEEVWTDEKAKWADENPYLYIDEKLDEKRRKLATLVMLEMFRPTPFIHYLTEQIKQEELVNMQARFQQLVEDHTGQWERIFRSFDYKFGSGGERVPEYINIEVRVDKLQTVQMIEGFVRQFEVTRYTRLEEWMVNYQAKLEKQIYALMDELKTDMGDGWHEISALKKEHYHIIHHREQDGWIPVKTDEEREIIKTPNYARRGSVSFSRTYISSQSQQIYDMIADKPRTFADLWNEMQVNLANLPPFNCYIQTINDRHEITQSQLVTETPPAKQPDGKRQAEEIIQRSRDYFGRPAEQVRQEANNRIAPFLMKPEEKKASSASTNAGKPIEKIERGKPYP
jgi:hypothetical protein